MSSALKCSTPLSTLMRPMLTLKKQFKKSIINLVIVYILSLYILYNYPAFFTLSGIFVVASRQCFWYYSDGIMIVLLNGSTSFRGQLVWTGYSKNLTSY